MRRLTPSSLDPFTVFREVVNAKQPGPRRDRLSQRFGVVRGYYKDFDASKRRLEQITRHRYKAHQKEDLEYCYTIRTKPLDRLLSDIKSKLPAIIIDKCQYCNIDNPKTFDHYLSKKRFPEYAIHALNLFPCCHPCNQIKSEAFLDVLGNRRVLNFYFDAIPKRQFLNVRISYDAHGDPLASYNLARPPWLRRTIFKLVESHFEVLDLLNRYRESSHAVFSETVNTMQELSWDAHRVQELLRGQAATLTRDISPNYWRAVLYQAMADDLRFVALCTL